MRANSTEGNGGKRGSVDAAEVARFAALAGAWWDEAGPHRQLHALTRPRIGYIRDHLVRHFAHDDSARRPLTGLRILDVGCGGGLAAEPLARLGAMVTGIDADAQGVAVAQAHARQSGLTIDYRVAAAEDLVARGNAFDSVIALEVVEHVADVEAFVGTLARLTRPGGALVLSTINRTRRSLALAIIAAEYILRWVPPGTHDWRKFVTPAELAAGLGRHGATVENTAGLVWRPLTGEWQISNDRVAVNYFVFAVKAGRAARRRSA